MTIIASACLLATAAMAQWNADSTEYDSFAHLRVGGYGETVANFKNYGINRFNGTSEGNSRLKRNTIGIPRMVLAGDVKWGSHFRLGMEVEFEYGGTGQVYELENTENGEYEVEMEKGGEVAIEQFHLTYHLNNHFEVSVGHMIVPVGLTNSHHEPINFRWEYTGVPGLRLGASAYYCPNVAANSDKPDTYHFRAPVFIWNVDAQYRCRWVEARANIMQGHLSNSDLLSAKNALLSNKSPYSRTTPIASLAVCYGGEAGFRLSPLFHRRYTDLTPFVRYEYHNTQQEVRNAIPDDRLQTSQWTVGINYKPLPFLVVKADYTNRRIGGGKYNNENEFAIGVAFVNWFYKK